MKFVLVTAISLLVTVSVSANSKKIEPPRKPTAASGEFFCFAHPAMTTTNVRENIEKHISSYCDTNKPFSTSSFAEKSGFLYVYATTCCTAK